MKRVFLTLLLILLLPAGASGQNILPATLELFGMGGATLPTGTLNDSFDMGYNVGGGGALYFTPHLAAGLSFVYHSFSDEGLLGDTLSVDVDLRIWEIMAFAKYQFIPGPEISPYAKFEIGAFHNDAKISRGGLSTPIADGTEFGLGGGLGIQGRLKDNVGLFVEGMYLINFTERDTAELISLRLGINLYVKPTPVTN
jgi:opacity protein-like surface antigen